MPGPTQSRVALLLDERNHVEKPLFDQLVGLGWEVINPTDMKQTPADTHRESLTDVVIPPVLRELHKVTNWLEDNQIEKGVKQVAGEYRVTPLLESVEPN